MKYAGWLDSNRSNDDRLRAGGDTRERGDGGAAPAVSFDGDGDRFLDRRAGMGAVGNFSVGFEHHDQRFFEVALGFRQGAALGVDAGDFLDVPDVPLAALEVDCRKLTNHCVSSIAQARPPRQRRCGGHR